VVLDGLDDVRALLPTRRLKGFEPLGGSTRSQVSRVSADRGTLIVKAFVGTDDGWVRECAALSVMPVEAPTPRLVAAGAVPPIVVMSDAGPGTSVADALLGSDPVAGADAVVAWATALASLHRATAGLRDAFGEALAARAGDLRIPASRVAADLDDAARLIARYCEELGVNVPAAALSELRGLGSRLSGTGPAAMTPADACPDNNVSTSTGMVLIDFESAQWRHLAWDVAYLTVPWPSCWCSWRIPAGVTERAVDAYRTVVASPYVDSPRFRSDVAAATVGWAFISMSWFLPRALRDDPPMTDATKPAPTRRALILHRLGHVRTSADHPALAELADRLHHTLIQRWEAVPLAYAPAFNKR
jgi:hypothetical protein